MIGKECLIQYGTLMHDYKKPKSHPRGWKSETLTDLEVTGGGKGAARNFF